MKIIVYVVNRIHLIFLVYVVSLLCAAHLFSIFEDRSFGDGLWWAVVTALTIGYGDLAPASAAGRIAGVVFGHFWVFGVIPMIIGNIVVRVLEDKNAFTHEEQEWQERMLARIAAKVGADCEEAPSDY